MKLGRRHAVHDPRTLQLAKYFHRTAPAAPAIVDYTAAVSSWGMYLNDQIGDCTIATAGNILRAWTASQHVEVDVSEDDVLAAYEGVSGYQPDDPSTDRGAVELDVLRYWRKNGIGGHKIGAFASVEIGSQALVRDAVWLFTGLYAGVALPLSAQAQDVWEVPPGGAEGLATRGSWGGHAVPILGADDRGLTIVTWGAPKRVSWSFFDTYFDEAYAVVSQDYIDGSKKAPSGFSMDQLIADLALI